MNPTKAKHLRRLAINLAVMAVLTLVPCGTVREVGILGYRSLCPMAPVSTIISLYLALTIYRYFASYTRKV